MKIEISYDIKKEYKNFKNSFNSSNHSQQSNRQQEFFSQFPELTEENSLKFVGNYLEVNKIDIQALAKVIGSNWLLIEDAFFSKAKNIFNCELPFEKIMIWLTIHDRCSYDFLRGEFFVHLHLPATNKTIMHELWHFYFYSTVGEKIKEEYGQQITNDLKEALTVLLNVEFADLLGVITDKGYPQHAELRKNIVETYQREKDIYKTIDCTLKQLKTGGENDSNYCSVGVNRKM